MIEALRFGTSKGSEGVYVDGDVIVVALPDHPWGTEDKRVHTVCQIADATLESALLAKKADGDDYPVITYPYADYDIQADSEDIVTLTAVSTKYIDISSLSYAKQRKVRNKTTSLDILTLSECTLKDR